MHRPISPPPLKRRQLHIYAWNVNGVRPFLPRITPSITTFLHGAPSQPEGPSMRHCLRNWIWPEIVCLQEVKIAHSDIQTQRAFRRAVATGPGAEYEVHYCLPRDKFNATGFGGRVHGVATLVRKDVKADVKTVDWDLEGRILLCELTQRIVVINVYAVNGTRFDYRDSHTGEVIGTRHDRKCIFHSRLATTVEEYESRGWRVLIIGDLNISRTTMDSFPQLRLDPEHVRNRADFEEKFIQSLGMLDTFRHLHPQSRKYTYRPRSKAWGRGGDRVDMALLSRSLATGLLEADILDTEQDRGPSDHVPLFVKLWIDV